MLYVVLSKDTIGVHVRVCMWVRARIAYSSYSVTAITIGNFYSVQFLPAQPRPVHNINGPGAYYSLFVYLRFLLLVLLASTRDVPSHPYGAVYRLNTASAPEIRDNKMKKEHEEEGRSSRKDKRLRVVISLAQRPFEGEL